MDVDGIYVYEDANTQGGPVVPVRPGLCVSWPVTASGPSSIGRRPENRGVNIIAYMFQALTKENPANLRQPVQGFSLYLRFKPSALNRVFLICGAVAMRLQ